MNDLIIHSLTLIDNKSHIGYFLLPSIFIYLVLKYLCRKINGIDSFSLKKAEVRFAELERIEKVLWTLQKYNSSLLRRKSYEILFKKSTPHIEIEYLDLIMRYNDQFKAFKCLVSVYFYIDRSLKTEIVEKKYTDWKRCFLNLRTEKFYITFYFFFATVSLSILFSPNYLLKETFKIESGESLALLLILYFIAIIIAVPIFCIAKSMLDKLLVVRNLEWLDENKPTEIRPEQEEPNHYSGDVKDSPGVIAGNRLSAAELNENQNLHNIPKQSNSDYVPKFIRDICVFINKKFKS